MIGSAVGPAPYPALVRDLQRVIGDEIREQIQAAEGRLPDRVIACVGGGSNAIGAFVPFVRDAEVELIGVEAAGEGLDSGRHSAPLTTGARGVLHGALSAVLQDERRPGAGGALGLGRASTTPASGPEHAWLRDEGRVRYDAVPDDGRARRPSARSRELEGIIPALEPAHALAWLLANPARRHRRAGALGPRRQGPGRGAWPSERDGADRGRAAFAGSRPRGRAALMPYLMGGHPGPRDVQGAACAAAADAGADLIELGVPFSDPLADGPVIHAAGTEALDAGVTPDDVLRHVRGGRRRGCRWC